MVRISTLEKWVRQERENPLPAPRRCRFVADGALRPPASSLAAFTLPETMRERLSRAGSRTEFAVAQGMFTAVARPTSVQSSATLWVIAPLLRFACTSRSSTTVRLIASSRPLPTFARRLNSRLSENQVSFSLSGRVTHDAQKGFFKLFNANGKYFKPSALRSKDDSSL